MKTEICNFYIYVSTSLNVKSFSVDWLRNDTWLLTSHNVITDAFYSAEETAALRCCDNVTNKHVPSKLAIPLQSQYVSLVSTNFIIHPTDCVYLFVAMEFKCRSCKQPVFALSNLKLLLIYVFICRIERNSKQRNLLLHIRCRTLRSHVHYSSHQMNKSKPIGGCKTESFQLFWGVLLFSRWWKQASFVETTHEKSRLASWIRSGSMM